MSSPRRPQRILVILDGCGLGDALRVAFCVSAIRAARPDAHITLLVAAAAREAVARLDAVDRLVVSRIYRDTSHGPRRRRLFQAWEALRVLVALGPRHDLAITLWRGTTALNVIARVLAPRVYGYQNGLPRLVSGGLKGYLPNVPVVEQNIAILAAAGIATPAATPTLPEPSAGEEAELQALLRGHPITDGPLVVLHPGSDWACQQWRPERWSVVADSLVGRYGARVVLVGVKSETGMVASITGQMARAALDLTGRTSLAQMTSLLRRADLCLCVDTAIHELSQGVGTPTVVLAGPTDPGGALASGRRSIVLNRASAELRMNIAVCQGLHYYGCLDFACPMAGLRDLTVEHVLQAAERALGRSRAVGEGA